MLERVGGWGRRDPAGPMTWLAVPMPEGEGARWSWLRRLARGLGLAMLLTAGGGTGWHLGGWQERFVASDAVLTRLRTSVERARPMRGAVTAAAIPESPPSVTSDGELPEPSKPVVPPSPSAKQGQIDVPTIVETTLDPRDREVVPPAAVAAGTSGESALQTTSATQESAFSVASRGPGAVVMYLVQPGDTLAALAERFGVDAELIQLLNGLADGELLAGQTLRIPTVQGAVHIVRAGETLSEIAEAYGVALGTITEGNQLDTDVIVPGERLLITGARPHPHIAARPTLAPPTSTPSLSPSPRPTRPAPTPSAPPVQRAVSLPTPTPTLPPTPARPASTPFAAPRVLPGGALLWPVSGVITQRFGENGHLGLDIAAATGTPVRAAAAGRVVVAAKLDYGYGWRIVIDHGDYTTLYAHLSAINVSEGDRVGRGQVIGAVGATGKATGPHLHFEVGIDGRPVDPQRYLP